MTSKSSEILNTSPVETADYYKHLSLFWTDIIHLMSSKPQALTSIGPMRAFAANSKKISVELIEINEKLFEFNKYMTEYYKQLSSVWGIAQKKATDPIVSSPRKKSISNCIPSCPPTQKF